MDASDRRRRASEEAATWWVRLQTKELERADREEFVDWLRESAVHVAEMLRVAKVHDALEQFQGWAQIANGPDDGGNDDDNIVSLPPHPKPASLRVPDIARDEASPRTTRRRLWIGAIAASLAAFAIVGVILFASLRSQTIQTERGERREVALADGSVLQVDPETRLRVTFEEHARRVSLERGRALFRVAKNPERPFLVQANGTTVRAVGTAFAVERQKQGVVVTVAEGKVAVFATDPAGFPEGKETPDAGEAAGAAEKEGTASTSPALKASPSSRARSNAQVLLTAGQQVTMQSSGTAEPVRKVDSERELAWAKGRLVFDNETVATAIEEFNRYNRVRLRVTDQALAARPVSGIFDASDPESFIGFLETVTSVRVTRSENEIIMQ